MRQERNIPGEAMACAVCKRALNVRTDIYTGAIQGWEHGWKMDHEPVPVPMRETLDAVVLCDFCGHIGVITDQWWTLYCTDWMEIVQDHEHWYGEEWACCEQCATLVSNDQWEELGWRSAIEHMRKDGFTTSDYIHEIFRLQSEVHKNFLRIEKDADSPTT